MIIHAGSKMARGLAPEFYYGQIETEEDIENFKKKYAPVKPVPKKDQENQTYKTSDVIRELEEEFEREKKRTHLKKSVTINYRKKSIEMFDDEEVREQLKEQHPDLCPYIDPVAAEFDGVKVEFADGHSGTLYNKKILEKIESVLAEIKIGDCYGY